MRRRITRMDLTRKHNRMGRGIQVYGLEWAICRQKWNAKPRRNLAPVFRTWQGAD